MSRQTNNTRKDSSSDGKTGGHGRSIILSDGGTVISSRSADANTCTVSIENLGGISRAESSIFEGISALVGRNATNRTSTCRALVAALGGDESAATLKTDADEGAVEIVFRDTSYTRTYARNGDSVHRGGDPYTDDADLVDTFVALFADCPARRAVERGDGLRDVLMKPVDTAEIQHRIDELKRKRADLDDIISDANHEKRKLPVLEEERTQLQAELSTVEDEIAELEAQIADTEPPTEPTEEIAEYRTTLSSLRDDLTAADRRLGELDQQLEFRQGERDDLREKRESLESALQECDDPGVIEAQIAELTAKIDELSTRKTRLDQAVEDLQSVIRTNKTLLEDGIENATFVAEDSVSGALDPKSQSVECWTCGTEVERGAVNDRIETLREVVAKHRTELSDLEEQLSELDEKKAAHETRVEEHRRRTERLETLDDRIEQHTNKIGKLKEKRKEIEAEIETLEDEIATVEAEIEQAEIKSEQETNELVEAHKKLTRLERRRGRSENQLEGKITEIERIRALDERRTEAEQQRAGIDEELDDLRTRITRLETDLVETLNSIMEDLLRRLEYDNVARVWLERHVDDTDAQSSFVLRIVREGDDGAVYEDSVDTLSESERELIGLVVSLAGYLVHDVDQQIPFLILDSVEMIDGERLAALLEYILDRTDVEFLVAALLEKDAESVEAAADFEQYSRIDFEVTSS